MSDWFIILHSVSVSKCSITSFICKYYNFYHPTFFLLKICLKICFLCAYYEYMRPLKIGGGGGRGVTVLVSSQHDDKWVAKGQFQLQSDLFPGKDWGEFQNSTLTKKNYHDCTWKLLNSKSGHCCLSLDGQREMPSSPKSQCYAQSEMRGAKQGNHLKPIIKGYSSCF